LVLLETIQFVIQTGRPAVKSDTQYQLVNSKSPMYDYVNAFKATGIFNEMLACYTNCIDTSLEEMDHELAEFELDDETDSDDEQSTHHLVPFNVSNPHYHHKYSSKNSFKEKIGYFSLYILKTIFNDEFEASIKQSQNDNSMCHALGGMAVGNNNHSKMTDLVDIFGKMSYSK
jgi:hypothetical protein